MPRTRSVPVVRIVAALLALGVGATLPATARADVACDRHAATSGDDAHPGTAAAPVATVRRLTDLLQAGQTGCLRAGDTFETLAFMPASGRPGHRITLTSSPGGRASVTGQVAFAGSDIDVRGIAFRGLGEIARTYPKTAHVIVNGDRVRLLDNDITSPKGICLDVGEIDGYAAGAEENATTIQRADDFVLEGNRIHGCGRQNWADGEITARDSGVHGVYLVHTRNAVIRDNVVTGNLNRGIQLWPRNEGALVERNTIDANGSNINLGSSPITGTSRRARSSATT